MSASRVVDSDRENVAAATGGCNPRLQPLTPGSRLVNDAAERVYAAWRLHLGHDAALTEARRFAGRFFVPLIDGPLAPLPAEAELEAQLAAVAAAMNILDATAEALA